MKQTPIILLFLSIGFGILYWLLKPSTAQFSSIDSDYDGVIDANDREKNTAWLADTNNYKLKDYVDQDGLIDRSKTKNLCDCWEFPNSSDREILKCKNNLNWFTYEGKLIEYRMEGSENGRFYSNSSLIIATQKDNEIEKKHENLFPEHYANDEDVIINEPSSKDLNELVTISYNGKKYQIKKGFTIEKGLSFNNANYRFKGNNWEIQTNPPSGTWNMAKEMDINYILNKIAKEIITVKVLVEKGNEGGNTIPKNNVGSTELNTEADNYWIYLDQLSEEKIISKKVEIKLNLNSRDKKPSTLAGSKARRNILRKLNNL